MRSAASLATEIEALKSRISYLGEKVERLRKEHNAAAVAEAQNKHPWIGKKVKQTVTKGFRRKQMTRKGVLTVYDREKHRTLRELYRPEPGQLFVLTEGGQTGYAFYTEQEIININSWRGSTEREQPWELDE